MNPIKLNFHRKTNNGTEIILESTVKFSTLVCNIVLKIVTEKNHWCRE